MQNINISLSKALEKLFKIKPIKQESVRVSRTKTPFVYQHAGKEYNVIVQVDIVENTAHYSQKWMPDRKETEVVCKTYYKPNSVVKTELSKVIGVLIYSKTHFYPLFRSPEWVGKYVINITNNVGALTLKKFNKIAAEY